MTAIIGSRIYVSGEFFMRYMVHMIFLSNFSQLVALPAYTSQRQQTHAESFSDF